MGVRLLALVFNATLPLLELVVPSQLENAIHHGVEDSRMADLLCGQIALMGAIDAVKSEAPPERWSSWSRSPSCD
jgi:hypothetical protein